MKPSTLHAFVLYLQWQFNMLNVNENGSSLFLWHLCLSYQYIQSLEEQDKDHFGQYIYICLTKPLSIIHPISKTIISNTIIGKWIFHINSLLKLDSSPQMKYHLINHWSKKLYIPLTQSPGFLFYIPFYWGARIQFQYAEDWLWEFEIAQINVS